MRIVFAGSPDAALPTLDALAGAHDVVAVLTRRPSPVGRKRVITPTAVGRRAAELGLHVIEADRPDDETAAAVRRLDADLGVVVAYGALLRAPLLEAPRSGWINLHFSSLPEYRGAAPLQQALIDGREQVGMTVFRLVPELDAGDVVAETTVDLEQHETAGEALTRLAGLGAGLVSDAVDGIGAGDAVFTPQVGAPTHAPKLARADGRLDFSRPSDELYARFRGVTPEPGAWVETPEGVVKVLSMRPADASEEAAPEAATLLGGRALASARDGALELLRVQPAGRAPMDAAAWLRGRGGAVALSAGGAA